MLVTPIEIKLVGPFKVIIAGIEVTYRHLIEMFLLSTTDSPERPRYAIGREGLLPGQAVMALRSSATLCSFFVSLRLPVIALPSCPSYSGADALDRRWRRCVLSRSGSRKDAEGGPLLRWVGRLMVAAAGEAGERAATVATGLLDGETDGDGSDLAAGLRDHGDAGEWMRTELEQWVVRLDEGRLKGSGVGCRLERGRSWWKQLGVVARRRLMGADGKRRRWQGDLPWKTMAKLSVGRLSLLVGENGVAGSCGRTVGCCSRRRRRWKEMREASGCGRKWGSSAVEVGEDDDGAPYWCCMLRRGTINGVPVDVDFKF
ncbi:hypothetical protein ACLOJK_008079 [Asimina triloba]